MREHQLIPILLYATLPASAVAQSAYLVTDSGLQAVVRVAAGSGDRTIVSGAGIGTGTAFDTPRGIDVEANGNIVVCDEVLHVVFRVDPVTGDRSIVSSASVGSGTTFLAAQDLVVGPGGDLLLTAATPTESWALLRIDPDNGDRTIVSSASVGGGAAVGGGSDLVVDGNSVVLINNTIEVVYRVDLTTGSRTLISSPTLGGGPVFESFSGLAIDAAGDILVTDAGFVRDPLLGLVDAATGDRTVVSSAAIGSGPLPVQPFAVVVSPCDEIVVLDNLGPFLFRVDPVSGDRTMLSSGSVGVGPGFVAPRDLIAEPGSCATVVANGAGCGSLTLAAVGRPVQGAAAVDFEVTTGNIPGTALSHVGVFGFASPGLPLAGLGLPGCLLNASLDVLQFDFPIAGSSYTWTALTLPAGPVFFGGFEFHCQGAIFGTGQNQAFGLGVLTSNGLSCTVGSW